MSERKYKKAAQIIIKAGMLPFPVTKTLIKLVEILYTEEELEFIINAFKRRVSQTLEQLKETTKMTEQEILKITDSLAQKGALFNQPNSKGIMVYRLLPLIFVGIFEYYLMKKIEYSEEEKRVAKLFSELFEELRDIVQERYDMFLPAFKNVPPLDRTVPLYEDEGGEEISIEVNKEVSQPEERVLTSNRIEEIVNKFDDITVGHCFCRQHQDLLGNSCEITDLRENCFTFGKSARFVAEQGFGRKISKEEALEIMKKSEEEGLIHKAYHPFGKIEKLETSVCNCCKDCCGTFNLWKEGVLPMINYTDFLSEIDEDLCIGCGTCIEKCPVDAIHLNDQNKAKRNAEWCIGCGICAHFCPESAISLLEGQRKVFVPPPKLRK
ncbi:MAG: 4Fe-4S ferredoxin iron-sulfur binding domain protein [Promethearchaeota archaeon]|nr:MAG: 4Fe-4S ferredoxin iron-sulfur binding domain protein [Candidatus Lokiarchaeota archaeon]